MELAECPYFAWESKADEQHITTARIFRSRVQISRPFRKDRRGENTSLYCGEALSSAHRRDIPVSVLGPHETWVWFSLNHWLYRDLREYRYLVLKVHVRSKRTLPEVAVVEHLRESQDDHPGKRFVRLIHTDIQPNNILARVEDESALSILEQNELSSPSPRKLDGDRIIYLSRPMFLTKGEPLLSDLGEARVGRSQKGIIMPSLYRAPEVILGLDWNSKVDIWGLGQTIWTIFEGSHLFRTGSQGELEKMQRFAEMTSLLGPPPKEFRKQSRECSDYWDENDNSKGSVSIHGQSLELREKKLEGEEKAQFLRLMRKTLAWLPEERPSAEELLYDEWKRGDDY